MMTLKNALHDFLYGDKSSKLTRDQMMDIISSGQYVTKKIQLNGVDYAIDYVTMGNHTAPFHVLQASNHEASEELVIAVENVWGGNLLDREFETLGGDRVKYHIWLEMRDSSGVRSYECRMYAYILRSRFPDSEDQGKKLLSAVTDAVILFKMPINGQTVHTVASVSLERAVQEESFEYAPQYAGRTIDLFNQKLFVSDKPHVIIP